MPGQTQTFLIGDSLYLRPVRYDDATTAAIWSASSFPAPDEVVRESLKKRLEVGFAVQNANQLLIACQRADDSIVGSAAVAITPFRSGEIELSIDRLAPPPMRHAIANELAEILVRWLLQECNLKWAALIADDAPEAPLETVTKLGGREAWRLRGASGAGERRRDRMCWQFFNPVWRALLGEPPPVRIGEPATRSWPSWPETQREGNTDLARAIAIGNRVYLRPIEPDESITVSEAWLQETEHYLPGGRTLGNRHTYAHVHKTIAVPDPPTWIRLATCLRDSGELIGVFGLRAIDWISRTAESQSGILRPEHRNQGYGMEIKQLLLDYAFNRLGMTMIWARVEEGNERSATALRKQGYRDAGYLAWTRLDAAGMCGDWYFDLLASEWRQSVAQPGAR